MVPLSDVKYAHIGTNCSGHDFQNAGVTEECWKRLSIELTDIPLIVVLEISMMGHVKTNDNGHDFAHRQTTITLTFSRTIFYQLFFAIEG